MNITPDLISVFLDQITLHKSLTRRGSLLPYRVPSPVGSHPYNSVMFDVVIPGIHIELNLDLLASLFVEITSAVITFEMCWSAVRVRKLRRQLAERE